MAAGVCRSRLDLRRDRRTHRLRHVIDPVGVKVERANRYRREIEQRLKAFEGIKAYKIRNDLEERGGRVGFRVSASEPESPPIEVALALGDFVHNLRSALDYLVGAMRIDGPTKDSAFPIFLRWVEQPSFRDRASKQLAGIPDEAKKRIEAMQPYEGRDTAGWRGLAALETLWNVDKHRTILLSTALVAPNYVWHRSAESQEIGIVQSLAPPDSEAHWWLPIDTGDQYGDPAFSVKVSLAKPRGFADDWPPWLSEWALESLMRMMHNTVQHQVLPQLQEFRNEGP
jgi:hypothetical protein